MMSNLHRYQFRYQIPEITPNSLRLQTQQCWIILLWSQWLFELSIHFCANTELENRRQKVIILDQPRGMRSASWYEIILVVCQQSQGACIGARLSGDVTRSWWLHAKHLNFGFVIHTDFWTMVFSENGSTVFAYQSEFFERNFHTLFGWKKY